MLRRIAICAVLICGPFGTAAAEPVLPAVHAVSGVSADDVLNVRDGPSTAHPVIGRLPNGAEVEVTALGGNGWARILHRGGDGWVAVRYLQVVDAPARPKALYCGGTEPFWSLDLEPDGALKFSEMGGATDVLSPEWRHGVSGRTYGSFAIWADGNAALFHRRECSDGMSDRTYGWTLDFLKTGGQGAYLQGCCRLLR